MLRLLSSCDTRLKLEYVVTGRGARLQMGRLGIMVTVDQLMEITYETACSL